MNTAKISLMRVGAAVILVALAFVLVAPAIQAATLLAIGGVQVSGSQVVVQVRNTTNATVAGYVDVEAVVGDTATSSSAPFALGTGASASICVTFPGAVSSVMKVSVIGDDSQPF